MTETSRQLSAAAAPVGGVLGETGAEVAERTRTAWGHRPPDLLLRGATVLLASGEFARRDIGIVGRRIALVAEDLVAPGEATMDLDGMTVVPGYVEPHAHTLGPLSVGSYCGQALLHGTTCIVSDDAFAYTFMPPELYPPMLDVSLRLPLVLRWSLRLESPRSFPLSGMLDLLDRDDVAQLGEVMTMQALVEPTAEVVEVLAAARSRGLRVEGHSPGASPRTLLAGAAAGLTADHESLRGDELIERLRAGLWAFIRYTDLLRDAPAIVAAMIASGTSFERTAFTSDWSLPPWMARRGTVDAALEAALEAGLEAEEAYACATWRPAAYEGLDAQVGVIAPGRLACLNVLDDPGTPFPRRVFSLGREVARDGELLVEVPEVEWEALGAPRWSERARGPAVEAYRPLPSDPAISLETPSMIRPGAGSHAGRPLVCVAIDGPAENLTRAAMHGFPEQLEGIASTLTPRRLLVAVGADPAAIARCVDAVIADGGGIAYQHRGELRRLPLPVGGAITAAPFAEVGEFWDGAKLFFAELGHELPDPLSTVLYIASSGLPGARFTPDGLVDTRAGRTIQPPRHVPWAA